MNKAEKAAIERTKQELANMERVKKQVQLHAVIDAEGTAMMQVHSHGLTAYGHADFQVLANSLFYHAASRLLNEVAYAVIIKGEKFKAGENCDYGEWGRFTLVEKTEAGRPVLRIVPLPMKCQACEEKRAA